MNSLFEKNIETLEEKRPHFYAQLKPHIDQFLEKPEGFNGTRYTLKKTAGEFDNLEVSKTESGQAFQYHADHPMKETEEIFKKAKLDHPQMVFFFGAGLGYMPKHFFDHRPEKNSFMGIVERDPQIFLRSLLIHDFSEIFKNKTVAFFVDSNLKKLQAEMSKTFERYATVSKTLKILATPAELQHHADYYNDAAKIIMQTRDRSIFSAGNSIEDSFKGYKNIIGNIDHAAKSVGLNPLVDQFKGKTLLSVAAGPDLERHWDQIKELQGKVPIVACDTILRAMIDRGIEPDFVTAVERVPVVGTFFEDVKIPYRTTLVGPLLLLPEAIEKFKGRRLLYCPTVQNASGLGFSYLRTYFPGASAGNLNIGLGCLLGFENIIMIGHNLAYGLQGHSHVQGTGIQKQDKPLTEEEILKKSRGVKLGTQDGKDEVYSSIWWKHFLSQIEDTIGDHPKMRFINTAPKGAKINGAELMELDEAMASVQPEPFDIYPDIKRLLAPIPEDQVKTRREEAIEKLKTHRDRLEHWRKEAEELMIEFKKWKSKIDDYEAQGKRVSLGFLDQRLDTVLKVKVSAVNEDPAFFSGAMSVMLPAHLAFERELNNMPGAYTDNYLLKRDFLLLHQKYFNLWLHWLPLLEAEINQYLESQT